MTFRRLSWMVDGHEEIEWERHSQLLAMIWNRTIWGDGKPKHPREFNPVWLGPRPESAPHDNKAAMARFWAQNTKIPVRRMKLVDGKWIEKGPAEE